MTTSPAERFDVVVVGAGPAGSTAGFLLARRGLRVLLVEKESLPRHKVCGGCLSRGALALLRRAGLADLSSIRRAPPIERFELRAGGSRCAIPVPGGRIVFRHDLDMELAISAQAAGAVLLDGTRASVGSWNGRCRAVELKGGGGTRKVEAGVVLVAGGLTGSLSVNDAGLRPVIHRRSRLGVGAVVAGREAPSGTVLMAVARGGYVGAAAAANGSTLVAAAISRAALRRHGGTVEALRAMWKEAGARCVPGIEDAQWQGTPQLTRAVVTPAADGLFLIGDAAAYEEPFTGEGMTWAIASAMAVTPLATEASRGWNPGMIAEWAGRNRGMLGRRRLRCRIIAALVRSPGFAAALVPVLGRLPGLGTALATSITSAPAVPESGS